MPLKFIGISQRLIENSNYFEIREALSLEWGEFFLQHLNGYLPLPLSYEIPFVEYAQRLNGTLKGIILSGGNDLNILNANQISQKRDEYEGQIITYCLEESLPLLGVCRGAQRVAEYFGANFTRSDIHIGKHSINSVRKYSDSSSYIHERLPFYSLRQILLLFSNILQRRILSDIDL